VITKLSVGLVRVSVMRIDSGLIRQEFQ